MEPVRRLPALVIVVVIMAAPRRPTDGNSDEKCLSDNATMVDKLLYRFSLHNGAYMMNATERTLLYLVFALVFVLVTWHMWAFGHGFLDGMRCSGDDQVCLAQRS